jgi:transcriptional regulator with XRE-family HTH domain
MAEPSPARRRLSRELGRIRTIAGISGRGMAAHLNVSQATVSRMDNARSIPTPEQARRWLNACGITDEATRDRVMGMVEAAAGETRPWADLLAGGTTHLQQQAHEREAGSRLVRTFQPTIVPGLLQTAAYARVILPLADVTGREDHEAALAARMERQALLDDENRRFDFLITEQVLAWSPGPGVMAAQRGRLAAAALLPSVRLGVLPIAAAAGLPWHNFVLYFPADNGGSPYVTAELIEGAHEVSDSVDVALYAALWDRLWAAAVVGDDAVAILRAPR